nr:phosphoribosylanthranilate isomerase [Virgibacillus natechei]
MVKICGIKTEEAAQTAVNAGADFIGFVFAPSKREITAEDAATIAQSIPPSVKKVGVFVNETIETMTEIATLVGLDFIQLHGDETPELAEQLPFKIIKAFPAEPEHFSAMHTYPSDFYLLDSPFGKNRGGNGTVFDWDVTRNLSIDRAKIMLAGGLTPENIQQARKQVNPGCVDVSSGVETNGEKDPKKIMNFIRLAKSTRKDESIDNIHNA